MPILVGVSADESSADSVALGAVFSQLLGEDVVVAHVQPPTIDYPSVGNVDAEWTAYLNEQASSILAAARERLATGWGISGVKSEIVANASVSRGLLDIADRIDASAIVVGPGGVSEASGVALGSTAQSLIHGAGVCVGLAPRGYAANLVERIGRLVVGFRDADPGIQALRWCLEVADRAGVDVELLTAIIRVTRIANPRLGPDPERTILEVLREQEIRAQQSVIEQVGRWVRGTVVQGDTAEQALAGFEWRSDDLLVMGSSRYGAISRVILGDVGKKLLRASTVPVLVLPRTA